MRKRFTVGALAAVMAASLLAASAASAAVEFGDSCTGNEAAPGDYTLTTLAAPAGGLPLTAPSAGVITKFKIRLDPIPIVVPTTIKTLRSAGGDNYTVIGQATVMAGGGETVADVRIPVQAGDRLGLHGQPFTYKGSTESISFYCEDLGGENRLGAVPNDVAPGSTAKFEAVDDSRIPVAAVIEPDVDNDGFGDETQDKCPQSAAVQVACPVVTVDSFSLVGSSAVQVLIATNGEAPVKVSGTVKLGKDGKANISGSTKGVPAGKLVRFTLKFPTKLKDKLKELTPSQKLQLKITASATNVAGLVSTDKTTAKLKGQG